MFAGQSHESLDDERRNPPDKHFLQIVFDVEDEHNAQKGMAY